MSTGVLGDGGLHAGKYNMRLAERAIRQRWPIPDDTREELVKQMAGIVSNGESDRDKVRAASVLVAADRVNVAAEALEKPEPGVNVQINQQFNTEVDVSHLSDEELRQVVATSKLLERRGRESAA